MRDVQKKTRVREQHATCQSRKIWWIQATWTKETLKVENVVVTEA